MKDTEKDTDEVRDKRILKLSITPLSTSKVLKKEQPSDFVCSQPKKGYTRVLRLGTPSTKTTDEGYTHLKLPSSKALKKSGARGSNSQVKVKAKCLERDATGEICQTSPACVDNKLNVSTLKESVNEYSALTVTSKGSSINGSSSTCLLNGSQVTERKRLSNPHQSDNGTCHHSEREMKQPAANTAQHSNLSEMTSFKKKLSFDKDKLSSAIRKIKHGPSASEDCNPKPSEERPRPGETCGPASAELHQELIPPCSTRPLEFDSPETVKKKPKKDQEKDKSPEKNGTGEIIRKAATDLVTQTLSHSLQIQDIEAKSNRLCVSNKKALITSIEQSGNKTKRTARKTIVKNKFTTEEMAMVQKYKLSEHLKENTPSTSVAQESISRNTSLVLSTLSRSVPTDLSAEKDKLIDVSCHIVPNVPKDHVSTKTPLVSVQVKSEGGVVANVLTDTPVQANSDSRKRPCSNDSMVVSKKVSKMASSKESTDLTSAFESTSLDKMLREAGFKDVPKTSTTLQNQTVCDTEKQKPEQTSSCDANEPKQPTNNAKEDAVPPVSSIAKNKPPSLETTTPSGDAERLGTGCQLQEKALDTLTEDTENNLAIVNIRSVPDSLTNDVHDQVDDPSYTPHGEKKLVGMYKFPNGAKIATIIRKGQLYCAVHELVVWLKIRLGGLTQSRCTPEEALLIRQLRRGNLKENFQFKVVPLSEVLTLITPKDNSKSETVTSTVSSVAISSPSTSSSQIVCSRSAGECAAIASTSSPLPSAVEKGSAACPESLVVTSEEMTKHNINASVPPTAVKTVSIAAYEPLPIRVALSGSHKVDVALPLVVGTAVTGTVTRLLNSAVSMDVETRQHVVATESVQTKSAQQSDNNLAQVEYVSLASSLSNSLPINSNIPLTTNSSNLLKETLTASKGEQSVGDTPADAAADSPSTPVASPDVIIVSESSNIQKTHRAENLPPSSQSSTKVRSVTETCSQYLLESENVQFTSKLVESLRPLRVRHHKKIRHLELVYYGELQVSDFMAQRAKIPFTIKCLGCSKFFSPFDFMLHLEEKDNDKDIRISDLWANCIVLDASLQANLEPPLIGFWNHFVDWFQLFVERLRKSPRFHDDLKNKRFVVQTGSPSVRYSNSGTALSNSSTVPSTSNSSTVSSNSSTASSNSSTVSSNSSTVPSSRSTETSPQLLASFDEIPASPAPYSLPNGHMPDSVAPETTLASNAHPESREAPAQQSVIQQSHIQQSQVPKRHYQQSKGQQRHAPHAIVHQLQTQQRRGLQLQAQQVSAAVQQTRSYPSGHSPLGYRAVNDQRSGSQLTALVQQHSLQQQSQSTVSPNAARSLPSYGYQQQYAMPQPDSMSGRSSSLSQSQSHGSSHRVSLHSMAPPSNPLEGTSMMTSFMQQPATIQGAESYARNRQYQHATQQPSSSDALHGGATQEQMASVPRQYYGSNHGSSSSTSTASGSLTPGDRFKKALSQQRMSMLSIEDTFLSLHKENLSLQSQLTAERNEKKEYAIRLQKALAESQAKDLEIQALKQQLGLRRIV